MFTSDPSLDPRTLDDRPVIPSEPSASALEAAQLRLAHLRLADDGDAWSAFAAGAEDVVRTLGIGRLGIWLFTGDRMAIRSYLVVQPSDDEMFEGALLHRRDFPTYFSALEAQHVVCADDARTSPLTVELVTSYLAPLGIGALMVAPIYREGRVVGVACHEHLGGARQWTDAERHVAASVAQTFARLSEEAERLDAESRMGVAHGQFERLERLAALARLAAGVAHDFRNVLHSVGVIAEMIQEECDGAAPVQSLASDIRVAVRRGEALVQNLLALGQEAPSTPSMLDIPGELRAMERLLTLSIGHDVQLEFSLADRVGRVFMDPKDLERVMVNLALNARDAMPNGGKMRISVRETEHDPGGLHNTTWVTVELRDNGAGIPAEVVPRLFEPFFTTKGERGTGLGLPIVEQLVSKAGGYVRVESAPGEGATFRLFLPRLAPAA